MTKFESLYEKYSRLVYWAAYGIVRNPQTAQDVCQDVFLRAVKNMEKLAKMEEQYQKAWLYRVAVNAAIDVTRNRKKEVITEDLPESAVEPESYDMPETAVMSAELREAVMEAIDALPEIYHEVIMLYYFSQMSYEEITLETGINMGTLKSRISRAKALLYNKLKGMDFLA